MSANDFLCLLCNKIITVFTKEKYGAKSCADDWTEIYRLYSYYVSLATGCELSHDYQCKLDAAFGDFTPTATVTSDSFTCAIAFNKVTVTPAACPTITIAAI